MSDGINALSPTIVEPIRQRWLLRREVDRASPPIRPEWQELSLVVDALSVRRGSLVVQFVGPARSVGTTVVSTGFAQAAALRGASTRDKDATRSLNSVLLLDCGQDSDVTWRRSRNMARSETVLEAYHRDPTLDSLLGVTIVAGIAKARLGLVDRDGAARCSSESVAEMIGALRSRYSLIVLDCPAISHSIAGLVLAPHSDGTIVVVRAGSTRSADLNTSRVRLEQVGGALVGVVFNRMRAKSHWWSRHAVR
jgi:Mrp family chromosome partitioning ATPase